MSKTTTPLTPAAQALLTAAEEGRVECVPDLLRQLDTAQRRACLPELKRLRTALREAPWAPPPAPARHSAALCLAGAGCHTGVAAAVQWLRSADWHYDMHSVLPVEVVLDVLSEHGQAWLVSLVERLAGNASTAEEYYSLVEGAVRRTGCAVPTSDGFVRGWLHAISRSQEATTLEERLRADRFTPYLVPRLFAVQGTGSTLIWNWAQRRQHEDEDLWPVALARLAAAGVLDRDMLIDGCVSRLLRGERPGQLRGFLQVLASLEPAEEELASRTGDWVRLVADAPSPVAGRAQEYLRALWEGGRLSAQSLSEASSGVLFRTEKALVRGQLALLRRALARDPADAPVLLPPVAQAFGHEDTDIQERALKLVLAHVGQQDAELRAELAPAVGSLDSGLRDRAAALLGQPLADDPAEEPERYEETLPVVERCRPMAPPLDSPYEVAEEVGAFLSSDRGGTVAQYERVLDGLVRHAHRDRAALAHALEPLLAPHFAGLLAGLEATAAAAGGSGGQRGDGGPPPAIWLLWPTHFLTLVAVAVLSPTGTLPAVHDRDGGCETDPYHQAVRARAREVAERVVHDPPPFLLATPSRADGTIEPHVLADRLREYRRAGATAGRIDFEQALLRVRVDESQDPRAAAQLLDVRSRLRSEGGEEERRLAQWLEAGGLPAPEQRRVVVDPPPPADWPSGRPWRRRIMVGTGENGPLRKEFGEPFSSLGLSRRPTLSCFHWGGEDLWAEYWLAVLPGHREALAARLLHQVADGATEASWGGALHLPALAEAPGPAGPGLHLALAYGLSARKPDDRRAATDAALVLASTGALDAGTLGRDLSELTGLGLAKPNRYTDALRSVARAGAHRTVWSVLAAALPLLLAEGANHRGMGDLLALGAECAEACGARGPIAEVDRIAAATGSTQLVKQARRLRALLEARAASTDTGVQR